MHACPEPEVRERGRPNPRCSAEGYFAESGLWALSSAVVLAGRRRRSAVRGQRLQCREVVAAVPVDRSTGSAAAKPMGSKRRLMLAEERDWLLERLASQLDVTRRALLAELAERQRHRQLWRDS